MQNYDRLCAFGKTLFLEWDQEEMIRRSALEADQEYLYIRYLGRPYRVCRATGDVTLLPDGRDAGPMASLTIFDYLCRDNFRPGMSGRRCAPNSLKHVAQSSPDTVSLHQRHADFLQGRLPALKSAMEQMGLASFPHGDAACLFEVFDGMETVFQFWEGDEEFPPSIRFLWDENSLHYLKYETLYYVMGAFLEELIARVSEIEKKR